MVIQNNYTTHKHNNNHSDFVGGDCGTTSILSSIIFPTVEAAVDNMEQVFTNSSSGTDIGTDSMDEVTYSPGHIELNDDPNENMNKYLDQKMTKTSSGDGAMGSNDSTILYISSSSDTSSEISGIDYTSLLKEFSEQNTPPIDIEQAPTFATNNCERAVILPNQKERTLETTAEDKEDNYLFQLSKAEIVSRSARKGIENEYESVGTGEDSSSDRYSPSPTQTHMGDEEENELLEEKENSPSSSKPSTSSLSSSFVEDLEDLRIHPITIVAGERLYSQAMERFERLALIADGQQVKPNEAPCPSRGRSSSLSEGMCQIEDRATSVKPRYLQLYETHVERMRKSRIAQPVTKSSLRSPSPSIPRGKKDRCHQLYCLSKSHQIQGRKRREEIQKASIKAKEVPNLYAGHISAKNAERLYYEGIKHIIDLDYRRVVAAEQLEIECQTYRFRSELRNKAEKSTQNR